MLAQWYAQALYYSIRDVSDKDAEKIFARFLYIVKRRGHMSLLRQITFLLRAEEEKDARKRGMTLIVAREKDAYRFEKHVLEFTESESHGENRRVARVRVDETIIGGYRLRTNTTLTDSSHKKHLFDIYRRITAR